MRGHFPLGKTAIFCKVAPEDFTKKFSIKWRAQRGKFFEYIIDLSGFFFRNSIIILNKLARAARKIFSYLIDFSRVS